MTEAQKCLYHIAENMRMDKSISKEGYEYFQQAIKALEQEPSRNMEEIKEVINCDADAETKCKMISNILTTKPHYFEEPQEIEE